MVEIEAKRPVNVPEVTKIRSVVGRDVDAVRARVDGVDEGVDADVGQTGCIDPRALERCEHIGHNLDILRRGAAGACQIDRRRGVGPRRSVWHAIGV